jgi:hypothetical protein
MNVRDIIMEATRRNKFFNQQVISKARQIMPLIDVWLIEGSGVVNEKKWQQLWDKYQEDLEGLADDFVQTISSKRDYQSFQDATIKHAVFDYITGFVRQKPLPALKGTNDIADVVALLVAYDEVEGSSEMLAGLKKFIGYSHNGNGVGPPSK